jgi:sugar (pentulose or hexulose) kinase
VTLSSGQQNLLPDGCEFLVRTTDSNGQRTLEYKSLSAAVTLGEAAVDSLIADAQTSSLEIKSVSSESGVSSYSQIWNFEHFDQRWYQLSDALSGAMRDVLLRDTETSSVRYIALSALSAGSVHLDSEGESGQKSIDWLSGSDPAEIQLYKMD